MTDVMLTVIMSNYNQEKYIKKAIDSVLMQKVNFAYKLIITDDCSSKDNSIQIIEQYSQQYPDIIFPIFNKCNGGYLTNILRAKSITKTPYFCLLDADDYYTDENFLQRAFDFLENNKEYVIYYENVNYLYEDGTEKPFISMDKKNESFEIQDYFNDNIPIVQTTGQFYRNVIFINGIPKIMSDAIGTESERSFEGDYDRFIMHLKYGKAYFNNNICGIYRVLSSGIWAGLTELDKNILQLQCWYDYNRYFEDKYKEFFIQKMYNQIKTIQNNINNNINNLRNIKISEKDIRIIGNLYNFIIDNKQLIIEYNINKNNKKQMLYKITNFLKRKNPNLSK